MPWNHLAANPDGRCIRVMSVVDLLRRSRDLSSRPSLLLHVFYYLLIQMDYIFVGPFGLFDAIDHTCSPNRARITSQ